VNAVEHMAGLLAPAAVRRIAGLRVHRFAARQLGGEPAPRTLDTDDARAYAIERWADDLCAFLNVLARDELAALALAIDLDASGKSSELRVRLWEAGARLERGDADVTDFVQPRPIILGGHLVVQAPPRGMYPRTTRWPRPIPAPAPAAPPDEEPETVDDLLAAADRAIGVRLGKRGADKGAWGMRAAALLGIVERGHDEPDWRGDVEVKTVPVALDPSGAWRIAEDPAIAMLNESGVALSKLQRTLWLVRANLPDGDATILSWYLLESDADIARLVRRYLHDRPKGPRGTDQRGLYLQKRFFADAGLLATLNGQP
jgi:hypothetical protein